MGATSIRQIQFSPKRVSDVILQNEPKDVSLQPPLNYKFWAESFLLRVHVGTNYLCPLQRFN
jgi:hypothetical protein